MFCGILNAPARYQDLSRERMADGQASMIASPVFRSINRHGLRRGGADT